MIQIGSISITADAAMVGILYIGYIIPIAASAYYWVKRPLLRSLPIICAEFIALTMIVKNSHVYNAEKIIEVLLLHVFIGAMFTIVSWLGWVESRKYIDQK